MQKGEHRRKVQGYAVHQVWLDPGLSALFSFVLASFVGRPSPFDGKMAFSRSMIFSDPTVDVIRKKHFLGSYSYRSPGPDLHEAN